MNKEQLKILLQAENSKRNVNLVSGMIGNNKKYFALLFDILINESHPYNHKAAWVITAVTDQYPDLLNPYLDELIPFLKRDLHEGIIRSIVRQLPLLKIPERHMGVLFDMCYTWAENPKTALAVRANAMTVLYTISNIHKELKPELIILFEQLGAEEAPAMKSRSSMLLKKLRQESK